MPETRYRLVEYFAGCCDYCSSDSDVLGTFDTLEGALEVAREDELVDNPFVWDDLFERWTTDPHHTSYHYHYICEVDE